MKMSSITGKRGSTESPATGGGGSEKKRAKVEFDFDSKLVATSEEELNIGLLRIQNRKLFERLRQRKRVEDDLRSRIDQLEKKQLTDDTKLYVINRYWNQLNEDIRLIIQRFDNDNSSLTNATTATTTTTNADSNEDSNESATSGLNEETSSFVRQLANCDKEELDEVMQQRVQLSTRAVEKVLLVLDRIAQRNEKLYAAIKGSADEAKEEHEADSTDESDPESSSIKSPKSPSPEGSDRHRKRRRNRRSYPPMNLDETVRGLNVELTAENKNLNGLVTSLHERHHVMSLKYAELKDKVDAKELAVDELKNRIDELEMELNKSRTREKRLEEHFYDAREKLRDLQNNGGGAGAGASGSADSANSKADSGLSSGRVEELKREIEEQRELAQSRLAELEALNNEHKETLKLMEKYKLDLQCIPDLVIRESAEYKSLQSHFSVLFNESVLLKNQVDEIRAQLASAKNAHLRQMEHMESEELCMQKKLRTELMQIEDRLAQRNKEYDMLRLEFEQTLAANEQTGPINREMRHLITSLQTHTQQLKGENARTKKKLKEANVEIARLKVIIEQNGLKVCSGGLLLPDPKVEGVAGAGHLLPPSSNEVKPVADLMSDSSNDGILVMASEGDVIKNELKSEPSTTPPQQPQHPSSATTPIKKDSPGLELIVEPAELAMFYEQGPTVPLSEPTPPGAVRSVAELEKTIRELKAQLKKSAEAQRELKLLLDAYKMADKEKRDKAQLMVTEKKLRQEIEELRNQIKKHQEAERRGDRRKLTDEEYARKIAKYEEVIGQLQKSVTSSKQEEEALLNEMEVTGQAFEDMQEQNDRLLQQLREKDDANFKLMSERIKSNQIQKMLKDEKDMLTDQVIAINNQLEAQNAVVRKLEEKERILQANVTSMENEVKARINYVEALKRKAIESSQATNDLKLHLDKYVTQIRDAQSIVADKTSAWQQETFKTKRLVEELQMYKRKYERAKKFEIASTADEVLQEEIRELKEELTCPSCKTKRKDAVLNKCFHVFCYDCLKTRYETRQRKCPKCNQSFSANDFHRLYLA